MRKKRFNQILKRWHWISIPFLIYLRNVSLKKYIKYSRDGVISQFSPYLYPFLTIFYPFFTSFICGTLEMALISIFLFSLYPFPITRFLCLHLFHPRYCRDGADSHIFNLSFFLLLLFTLLAVYIFAVQNLHKIKRYKLKRSAPIFDWLNRSTLLSILD